MSTTSTPNDSPIGTPIQPMHNPSQAAHVVVPQAPLGNVANQAPGMGAKALLAKKMAKNHNPNFISPTDNLMTPCTQKLNAAKKKHFTKGAKPVQLFAQQDEGSSDDHMDADEPIERKEKLETDDENPF
ncbi:putative spo12 family protein [Lyophyllum shimeji]|uniref:Spo12 family protein n=1 Tax=Lyophyllum shimeji TaxID=47721 RepID=A0A9P3PE09_LYOSH|nr:putative spo12 family protein [Lyophyllum shimeji]